MLAGAVALRKFATFVSSLASERYSSPIMNLHAPTRVPPRTSHREDLDDRVVEWSRSKGVALRFSIALAERDPAIRNEFVESLAARASDLGLGVWLSDTRGGYRAGNWFWVSQHDRARARRRLPVYSGVDAPKKAQEHVRAILPVTIVGPARVGSTHAILEYMSQWSGVGLAGITVTALDDLAFIHLQLCFGGMPAADLKRLWFPFVTKSFGVDSVLPAMSPEVFLGGLGEMLRDGGLGEMGVSDTQRSRLLGLCNDYQVLAGPPVATTHDGGRGRPIWISWLTLGAAAELRNGLQELYEVFREVELWGSDPDSLPVPNLEYLICRQLRGLRLSGKGKLSIAREEIPSWARNATEDAHVVLCSEIEQRWRARIAAKSLPVRVAVGDREHRVSRWSE